MDSEEALAYYLNELKDCHQEIEVEEEYAVLNEAEEAAEFLQNAGLSDLTRLYYEGKEISENLIIDSIRQRNLTRKQAQTIKSRVHTLNKTLCSRQPRRKHRQDIREVTWNPETTSNGSRSATPDSLDSVGVNEAFISDDELHPNINSLPDVASSSVFKRKIKWTSSEPLKTGCVAHLESDCVVLKQYRPLNENGSLPRSTRERSGSDPTTDVILETLKPSLNEPSSSKHQNNKLSRSQTNLVTSSSIEKTNDAPLAGADNYELMSFENCMKQNDLEIQVCEIETEGISIDDFTDSEYQHLKPLLFVEVISIFDQYKITYRKRKANIKSKGGNVFGVNVQTLVMRDMPKPTDNSMVPQVIQVLLHELNERCLGEHGIIRIALQKQKLDTLCSEIENKFYNSREEVEKQIREAHAHDLACTLKRLLKELPETLFTLEMFDMVFKTNLIPNNTDKMKAMNLIVLMLPIEHRNTLRVVLQFLLNVIMNEPENGMNLHNVAMLMAPSFFPPRLILPKDQDKPLKNISNEEVLKQLNGAAVCCSILEVLLKGGEKLWIVPGSLAEQAKEGHKRAQVRKDFNRNKKRDPKLRSSKVKLIRSSTMYDQSAISSPRMMAECRLQSTHS